MSEWTKTASFIKNEMQWVLQLKTRNRAEKNEHSPIPTRVAEERQLHATS